MKTITKSLIVVCLLVSVVAVLGCTVGAVDPIVGKWGNDAYTTGGVPIAENSLTLTFYSNGTYWGTIDSTGGTHRTWKSDGSGKYEMSPVSLGPVSNVTLNGNVLSLSVNNKPLRTFHKI